MGFFSPRQIKQTEMERQQLDLGRQLWGDRQRLRKFDTALVSAVRGLPDRSYQRGLEQVQARMPRAQYLPHRSLARGIGMNLQRARAVAGVRDNSPESYRRRLEQVIRTGRGMQSLGVQGANKQAIYGVNRQRQQLGNQLYRDALKSDVLGAGIAGGIGWARGDGLSQQDRMLREQWGPSDTLGSYWDSAKSYLGGLF